MDHAVVQAVDFELIAPQVPVKVPMQRELLAEALSNLINNAIRYTPAGGRVVKIDADRPLCAWPTPAQVSPTTNAHSSSNAS